MMIVEKIKAQFQNIFHAEPQIIVRSPGRINLIGEHTDYNGGYVLPAAIDKAVYFAVGIRKDKECHFVAHDLGENFKVSLEHLVKSDTHSWANYLMGVLQQVSPLLKDINANGINLVFGADLPSGGGMSSSAAIENGIGFALNELFELGLSRLDLVRISQQAENHFVGMNCGIMDMFASMMGVENQVIRIDCRSLTHEYFPLNAPDLRLVLCDTTVKHALVDSEYNTRRAECEEGVRVLQQFDASIALLRDVKIDFLKKHKKSLRPIVFKRCKYVVEEIERVERACGALQKNDFKTLGKLMYQTHDGLNEEYEVSCTELNFLVELTRSNPAVLGARMMGGGFGGCTINVVKAAEVEDFVEKMQAAYYRIFKKEMPYYVTTPQAGTNRI
jgi:galactokinase